MTYQQNISELIKSHQTMVDFRKSMNLPKEFIYNSNEEYVLKFGRGFVPDEFPSKYRKGEKKECYSNAFLLVLEYPEDLVYVEDLGILNFSLWNMLGVLIVRQEKL
jgi:hypothetical protein